MLDWRFDGKKKVALIFDYDPKLRRAFPSHVVLLCTLKLIRYCSPQILPTPISSLPR